MLKINTKIIDDIHKKNSTSGGLPYGFAVCTKKNLSETGPENPKPRPHPIGMYSN
jgi:hypothetical protein